MTSMAAAILRLFGNLAEELSRQNLPPGAVHAYIFGGCAIHLHTGHRSSTDVDAEFAYDNIHHNDVVLALKNTGEVYFEDPERGPSQLVIDSTFNTTLGPLHQDYQTRAVCIEGASDSPVTVFLPSPEDIAVTKLGRLGSVDIDDIIALLSLPSASFERFDQYALEAKAYYIGRDLTSNIDYVRKIFEERVRHARA